MSNPIVICVCTGDKYPVEYVRKLRSMVARHLSVEHEFRVLTDSTPKFIGYKVHPVKHSWPGWWQKVALFDPALLPPGRRVLYLDLDVVIQSGIDDLCLRTEPFIIGRNFSPNRSQSRFNSSVMAWEAGHPIPSSIYKQFRPELIKELHGDQCWISSLLPDSPTFDEGRIKSYKYHSLRGDKGGSVVVFHGKPDPSDVPNDPLVANHWK